jgi:hypothetical protein
MNDDAWMDGRSSCVAGRQQSRQPVRRGLIELGAIANGSARIAKNLAGLHQIRVAIDREPQFPDSLFLETDAERASDVRDSFTSSTGHRNLEIARANDVTLPPEKFAEMFVDDNFLEENIADD